MLLLRHTPIQTSGNHMNLITRHWTLACVNAGIQYPSRRWRHVYK